MNSLGKRSRGSFETFEGETDAIRSMLNTRHSLVDSVGEMIDSITPNSVDNASEQEPWFVIPDSQGEENEWNTEELECILTPEQHETAEDVEMFNLVDELESMHIQPKVRTFAQLVNKKWYLTKEVYELDGNVIVVKCPMGSGKTTALEHYLKGCEDYVLFVTCRKSLATGLAKRFDAIDYQLCSSAIPIDVVASEKRRVVVTINSLHRIADLGVFSFVIFDEFSSTCSMLASPLITCFAKTFSLFLKCFGENKKTILMDAMYSEREEELIKAITEELILPPPTSVVFEPPIRCLPYNMVYIEPDLGSFVGRLCRDISSKKSVSLSCNCANFCAKLVGLLRCGCPELYAALKLPIEVRNAVTGMKIVYVSKHQTKLVKRLVTGVYDDQFSLLVYTPVIGSGVSLDGVTVDNAYSLIVPGVGMTMELVQMIGRAREISSGKVYTHIKGDTGNCPVFSEKTLDSVIRATSNMVRCGAGKPQTLVGMLSMESSLERSSFLRAQRKQLDYLEQPSVKAFIKGTAKLQSRNNNNLRADYRHYVKMNHRDTRIIVLPRTGDRISITSNALERFIKNIDITAGKLVAEYDPTSGMKLDVISPCLLAGIDNGVFGVSGGVYCDIANIKLSEDACKILPLLKDTPMLNLITGCVSGYRRFVTECLEHGIYAPPKNLLYHNKEPHISFLYEFFVLLGLADKNNYQGIPILYDTPAIEYDRLIVYYNEFYALYERNIYLVGGDLFSKKKLTKQDPVNGINGKQLQAMRGWVLAILNNVGYCYETGKRGRIGNENESKEEYFARRYPDKVIKLKTKKPSYYPLIVPSSRRHEQISIIEMNHRRLYGLIMHVLSHRNPGSGTLLELAQNEGISTRWMCAMKEFLLYQCMKPIWQVTHPSLRSEEPDIAPPTTIDQF